MQLVQNVSGIRSSAENEKNNIRKAVRILVEYEEESSPQEENNTEGGQNGREENWRI